MTAVRTAGTACARSERSAARAASFRVPLDGVVGARHALRPPPRDRQPPHRGRAPLLPRHRAPRLRLGAPRAPQARTGRNLRQGLTLPKATLRRQTALPRRPRPTTTPAAAGRSEALIEWIAASGWTDADWMDVLRHHAREVLEAETKTGSPTRAMRHHLDRARNARPPQERESPYERAWTYAAAAALRRRNTRRGTRPPQKTAPARRTTMPRGDTEPPPRPRQIPSTALRLA